MHFVLSAAIRRQNREAFQWQFARRGEEASTMRERTANRRMRSAILAAAVKSQQPAKFKGLSQGKFRHVQLGGRHLWHTSCISLPLASEQQILAR